MMHAMWAQAILCDGFIWSYVHLFDTVADMYYTSAKLNDTVDHLMDGPIKVHLLTKSAQRTHQICHGQCCAPLSLCALQLSESQRLPDPPRLEGIMESLLLMSIDGFHSSFM